VKPKGFGTEQDKSCVTCPHFVIHSFDFDYRQKEGFWLSGSAGDSQDIGHVDKLKILTLRT